MPTYSAVAIDVEPQKGHIGVAELVADEITSSFLVRFDSPLPGTFRGPALGQSLPEVWPWLESFVGSRPVLAHSASYDVRALRQLLGAVGLPAPAWSVLCTYELVRQVLRRPEWRHSWKLASVLVGLGLVSEVERAARWQRYLEQGGNQWLLPTAEDDARGCLEVVQWVVRERSLTLEDVLGMLIPLTVS